MLVRRSPGPLFIFALVWCVIVAALVVSVGFAGSGGSSSVARFREVETRHVSLGTFAGATETWRVSVLLVGRTQVVGHGVVSCIHIDDGDGSATRECTATYFLPKGEIQLAGVSKGRTRYRLMVTGASGAYLGKDGVATFAQISTAPRQALVTFYFEDS
jgi:hypothetical protein